MPYHVVVGELPPPAAHLGGFAERGSVEVAQDLVAELGGEGGEEVNLDQVAHIG